MLLDTINAILDAYTPAECFACGGLIGADPLVWHLLTEPEDRICDLERARVEDAHARAAYAVACDNAAPLHMVVALTKLSAEASRALRRAEKAHTLPQEAD